jgi:membrane-associated phospholipid phosphatase
VKNILSKCFTFFVVGVFSCLTTLQIHAQNIGEPKVQVSANEKIGDVVVFALPITTLAVSFIADDKKGAWQFTKGLLLTLGVTYGLKYYIDKQRPDKSDNNSFPSGHTSTVFQSAGFLHRRYGFKYAIPSYVLAGFTATSRIDSKKHDILDIIAGAAIGLGSNLLFTTAYQQKHMELTYSNFDGNHMAGFKFKF